MLFYDIRNFGKLAFKFVRRAPRQIFPAKMLDNIYLDALTYTGYKTDVQKADGSIFKTYSGTAPASVRSGIGYGTGPSGLETVAADTKWAKRRI